MEKILNIVSSFEKNAEPDEILFEKFTNFIDFNVDKNFISLLKSSNGVQGELNSGEFLIIWTLSDIIELNPYYPEIEECKNMMFFGSNGSNIGYAFLKTGSSIISIDFFDLGYESPKYISYSFPEFLESL
ncbi:hypothetical protein FNO01nite_13950 [Flavobacterium noncentrifugens]|uniref:SMI1 / KNR4 family (SUKH-1) n=1 Tax=Flavobacterium noncentrifugens TaxID=1128970 RepID=A0A1G8W0E8_9FLAO|nr:hypothetical protein [Flavobacterium noncentrifugens]GEP50723.1 hypothetical protein FNO01nite_13950 [Flavobacterium noncentrifugens]SDJ71824.1 hypothetical protein SAMN04487935_1597 [Flavobacterium noncentrifugens]